jgi:hypothetical protein
VIWYNTARCYAQKHNIPVAIANLEQAISLCPAYLETIKSHSDFDKISSDQRFQALFQSH